MKHKKKLLFFILAIILCCLCCFEVKEKDLIIDRADTTKNKIIEIGSAGIEMPLGYFGLFRKDDKLCAIKFFESGEKKQEEGIVLNRYFYNYSKYEWYYIGRGNNNLNNEKVKYGKGKSTWYQIPLLGTPGLFLDNFDIVCGDLHMRRKHWLVLNFIKDDIFIMTRNEIEKEGFEIAPTKWKEIEEINLSDPRLKWYKADPNRELIKIPVDELW